MAARSNGGNLARWIGLAVSVSVISGGAIWRLSAVASKTDEAHRRVDEIVKRLEKIEAGVEKVGDVQVVIREQTREHAVATTMNTQLLTQIRDELRGQ